MGDVVANMAKEEVRGVGMGAGVDFVDEESMKEYLRKLSLEYRFGCYSEKDGQACELLAEYFDKVEDNQEQAYKINALNCEEREWPLSCYRAGSYKLTDEQAMNPDVGYKYLKKGCDLDFASSCTLAGLFHRANFGKVTTITKQDKAEGLNLLKKACDLGSPDGCDYYTSDVMVRITKPEEAAKYCEKGCLVGAKDCCYTLSRMYESGTGVQQDFARWRCFGCWNFTVFSWRSDAASPVLIEDQHGGAPLEPGVASLAGPIPVTRLPEGNVTVGIIFAERMFLAAGNILRPVTGVSLLVVEKSTNTELLGGGSVPAGPVASAGGLVPEYSVQPVTVLRALGGIGKILVFTNIGVSPGIVTPVSNALIFPNPN